MSVQVKERPNSRQRSDKPWKAMREYVVHGTGDEGYAHALVRDFSPTILTAPDAILYRHSYQVQEVGHLLWNVSVSYTEKDKENGSYTFSFDATAGTVRARTSKQTVARYPEDAADHKGLINVDKDGKVEGADIVIPALKLVVEFQHPKGFITIPQTKLLARTVGKSNSTEFLTFAPGEVLLVGVTGSVGSESPAALQYSLACSENATGLNIGDISGIAKDGHDLIWCTYEDYTTDDGKAATRPLAAYVERLYDRVNLAAILGFGG